MPPVTDMLSGFLGSFGDPEQWAQSTLKNVDIEDLVEVYKVVPGLLVSKENLRNRIWLHDMLDDMGIPYYIEVGGMKGSKDLMEAQHIYVEKENAQKAIFLILMYNNPGNVVSDEPDEEDQPVISNDGIPQKKCISCGEEIDFDHHKCPYCKAKV